MIFSVFLAILAPFGEPPGPPKIEKNVKNWSRTRLGGSLDALGLQSSILGRCLASRHRFWDDFSSDFGMIFGPSLKNAKKATKESSGRSLASKARFGSILNYFGWILEIILVWKTTSGTNRSKNNLWDKSFQKRPVRGYTLYAVRKSCRYKKNVPTNSPHQALSKKRGRACSPRSGSIFEKSLKFSKMFH